VLEIPIGGIFIDVVKIGDQRLVIQLDPRFRVIVEQ
jgi:preprotein translocase subunit YajC